MEMSLEDNIDDRVTETDKVNDVSKGCEKSMNTILKLTEEPPTEDEAIALVGHLIECSSCRQVFMRLQQLRMYGMERMDQEFAEAMPAMCLGQH